MYHITLTGTIISQFSVTDKIDASATRPQGLVLDPNTRTLWICDIVTDKVYNSSLTGSNISEFPTSAFDGGATHPSGMGFTLNKDLWLTDEDTDLVYNIEKDGTLITSFPRSAFEGSDFNISGIST